MINPTEADLDRKVYYTGNHNGPIEEGVITWFNDSVVFVRYGKDAGSKATKREDLEWERPQETPAPSIPRNSIGGPNCYMCRHRYDLSGDAHSGCVMLGARVRGYQHGIDNGWFLWPLNFDPAWLTECDRFDLKD